MAPTFDIKVTQLAQTKLYGIWVKTNMEKTQTDCSGLWKKFMPLAESLGLHDKLVETYGLSVMDDPNDMNSFIYWAAFPAGELATPPQGMEEIILPAGAYAKCTVASLETLGDGFAALYGWGQVSPDYAPSMTMPGFELYGPDYMGNGSLDLYIGLEKI